MESYLCTVMIRILHFSDENKPAIKYSFLDFISKWRVPELENVHAVLISFLVVTTWAELAYLHLDLQRNISLPRKTIFLKQLLLSTAVQ